MKTLTIVFDQKNKQYIISGNVSALKDLSDTIQEALDPLLEWSMESEFSSRENPNFSVIVKKLPD